jgi:hypothetical protein
MERCYTPAVMAGSGRGKSVRERSTADSSPSSFRSPERNASARSRPLAIPEILPPRVLIRAHVFVS